MSSIISFVLGLFSSLAGYAGPVPAQQAPAVTVSPQQALLNQYCVSCHNERLKTGGVMFDKMDIQHVGADAETWEKAVVQLRARAMPPAGRPRPDKATYDGFRVWLENALDNAAASHPDPGAKIAFHRLNRLEYQNVIKDLLGVDIDPSAFLPEDAISYGFDNIGGIIKMSPALLETYMTAASKISKAAVGVTSLSELTTYRLENDQTQDSRFDDLPFGTRGGMLANHYFPVDGEYWVTVRLVRLGTADISGLNDEHQIDFRVDGQRVDVAMIGKKGMQTINGGGGGNGTKDPDVAGLKADFQLRLPLKAGPHSISATFFMKPGLEGEGARILIDRPQYDAGRTHGLPYISSISILGPQRVTGTGMSPSRNLIFTCHPASRAQEPACARQIIGTLARRAYRGAAQPSDLESLMKFYETGRAAGTFDDGIQSAVERMLVSLKFLYRIEPPPATVTPALTAAGAYKISDVELASRLSFFLWNSMPDDQLLDAATKGRLKDPVVLEQQVKRMLADPRAKSLTDNFADQWLQLRNMADVYPDPVLFPEADKTLRQSLRAATQMLFDSIRVEDRSLLDLMTANYTFANEEIANLYGMPNIYGPTLRRVPVANDSPRVGLLGQGSILMLTSASTRTSPVLRGKWILDNLLGTPPPPPPPNVPPLEASNKGGKILSMRQQMELHRSNPACSGCHARMEPLGLSLENFDAVGRWRTLNEAGDAVDASGELIDGTKFDGVAGLRGVLLSSPEMFVQTGTEKLLTYALGRGVAYYDMPAVRKIVQDAARNKYSISSLVLGVVKSTPFQMRRLPQS